MAKDEEKEEEKEEVKEEENELTSMIKGLYDVKPMTVSPNKISTKKGLEKNKTRAGATASTSSKPPEVDVFSRLSKKQKIGYTRTEAPLQNPLKPVGLKQAQ